MTKENNKQKAKVQGQSKNGFNLTVINHIHS